VLHFGATFYFGQDTLKGKSHQYQYQLISKRKAARKIIHTTAPFLQRRNG